MHLSLSFKKMPPDDTLRVFIEEKSQVLKKYFNGKVSVTFSLSLENKYTCVAHCHLVGNTMDYYGEASTDDFKASIDFALHKIERQIRKHKETLKKHRT